MSEGDAVRGKFAVGDPVVVTSVNRGRGYDGTVTKVGRKLVTVANKRGREDVFRIDTGVKNDNYGHERVWTLADRAEFQARTGALSRIGERGLTFDYGRAVRYSTSDLTRIADLLDELSSAQADQ